MEELRPQEVADEQRNTEQPREGGLKQGLNSDNVRRSRGRGRGGRVRPGKRFRNTGGSVVPGCRYYKRSFFMNPWKELEEKMARDLVNTEEVELDLDDVVVGDGVVIGDDVGKVANGEKGVEMTKVDEGDDNVKMN